MANGPRERAMQVREERLAEERARMPAAPQTLEFPAESLSLAARTALLNYYRDRLAQLREANDTPKQDLETALTRGAINEVKRNLLRLEAAMNKPVMGEAVLGEL